ncbi:MAG TPA: NAD(P)H-binding protein [Candidatus Dormibacteraeota bacterium]|nr:NAD(P)H-binding protein [Candidatus Dormibacteraeota bacterium]
MRVAITGGTGLVGGHLAAALSAGGHEVVVIARGADRRPLAQSVIGLPGVTRVSAGIDDVSALERAFIGCEGVAHCAGINRELGKQRYEAVHVAGTRNVVAAAEAAGVKRLALVSFLRARPGSGSRYHETKWESEEIVRASRLEWTVTKPGMMFGRGDHLVDHLSRAMRTFPVYVGVGKRRVRPLAVEDLSRVLMSALVDQSLTRKTVALMGPTQIYFDDIARLVAWIVGRHPLFVRAPIRFHYLLAAVAEATMTVPLLSKAQVRILEEELIEPALAPDQLPPELVPSIPFNRQTVDAVTPVGERFHLDDLRMFSRRD